MSEYRLMTKAEYDTESAYFESEDFKNLGSIRFSLDNSTVLLEQESNKFPDTVEYLGTYTVEEIRQYLSDNITDWEKEGSD